MACEPGASPCEGRRILIAERPSARRLRYRLVAGHVGCTLPAPFRTAPRPTRPRPIGTVVRATDALFLADPAR